MKTESFKALSESVKRVMLREVHEAINYKNLVPSSMVKIKGYSENWVVVSANNDKVRVFSTMNYPENRTVVTFPTKDIVKVFAKKYNMDMNDMDEAADEVDTMSTEAPETEAPEVEEPEAEAPEVNDAPKNGKGKLKYAAVCSKDGVDSTVLLSKDGLEEFIHDNGTKCITALYELGKETKIPTVKVKA